MSKHRFALVTNNDGTITAFPENQVYRLEFHSDNGTHYYRRSGSVSPREIGSEGDLTLLDAAKAYIRAELHGVIARSDKKADQVSLPLVAVRDLLYAADALFASTSRLDITAYSQSEVKACAQAYNYARLAVAQHLPTDDATSR